MALEDELIIVIKTETVDLVRKLADAKNQLQDFGESGAFSINELNRALRAVAKEAENTRDPVRRLALAGNYQFLSNELTRVEKEWKILNGTIDESGRIVNRFNSQSNAAKPALSGIEDSTRRARIAVFGLNQVVRDLPFGFIAISNNLPVLIDQFVELRKTSGGTASALKSFGSSLFSIGGFSIAISAGIGLITYAVQQYGSLSNAFVELTGSITSAEAVQRDFNKAQAEGQKDAAIQIANLDRLVSLSKDAAIGARNQADASAILSQEIDKIVISQNNNKTATEAASDELVKYAKRVVIAKINLKAFDTVIGETAVELAKATLEGITFTDYIVASFKKINAFAAALRGGNLELASQIAKLNFADIANLRLKNRLEELENRQKKATAAADEYAKKQIAGGIAAIDLLDGGNELLRKRAKEESDAAKASARAARASEAALKKQNNELEKAAKAAEKARIEFELFRDALDRPIPFDPVSGIDIFKANIEEARKRLQELNKERRTGQQDLFDLSLPETEGVKASIESINRLLGVFKEQSGAALVAFEERAQIVTNLFNASLGPAIDSVFNAIENGENIFQALGDSLKQLVIDLAKTIVKAAVLAAILTAISGGTFSLATFGGFFKEILSGGGRLGSAALGVGDLGGRRGVAAPNISGPGGFALAGQVVFVQRGTDLVGVLDRSNARIGRVG